MEPETSPDQPWPQSTSTFAGERGPFEPPSGPLQPPAGPPVARPAAAPMIGMTAGTGLQMKARSPIGVWLLSIITLGIYGLVYWYKIHAELARFDPRVKISPVFELMSVWLLGWTIVLPVISVVGLGAKIRAAQAAAGQPQDCSGGLGLLFAVLAGTHVIYYQSKLNQVIGASSVPAGQPVTLAA